MMNKTDRIFKLDSIESCNRADRFINKLWNQGYEVDSKPFGLNGVRISAKKKLRRCV